MTGRNRHNERAEQRAEEQETTDCEKLAPLFNGSVAKCEAELAKLKSLAKALGDKDPYTQAHSARVEAYAEVIAGELGVDEDEMWEIAKAAALHDVGKLGVPNEILSKPDKLTEEEYAIIRQHPGIAAVVLRHLLYPNEWVNFVYHHHEWYNGEGYPARRAGEDIPLGSRVIAVADAFDAMTSDRPYRKAVSPTKAERELVACSGSQFDPDVVDAFRRAKRKGKLRAS